MTKEELEKEAREDVDSLNGVDLVSSTMVAIDRYGAYKIGRYDGYLAGAEPREKQNEELKEKLKKETAQRIYNFNKSIEWKERHRKLEAQIEKMKCYLPVDERDCDHKWFAYKNLFDTEWKIDYSVQGALPKCNTIKWFENKEAVMFYLVSNGMKYYEEPRR